MTQAPPQPLQLQSFQVGDLPVFTGVKLADVSSQHTTHRGHAGEWATTREQCSACRWTEVAVYRRSTFHDADGRATYDYVVERLGASEVPGETDRVTVTETASGFEVVELLTVRPRNGEPFMPPQHARALAAASHLDDGIREAWINRAVA